MTARMPGTTLEWSSFRLFNESLQGVSRPWILLGEVTVSKHDKDVLCCQVEYSDRDFENITSEPGSVQLLEELDVAVLAAKAKQTKATRLNKTQRWQQPQEDGVISQHNYRTLSSLTSRQLATYLQGVKE
jgi:hypothetical protein